MTGLCVVTHLTSPADLSRGMFSCSVDCGFMCQLRQQSLPSLGSLKEGVEKMDSDYFQILKTSQNTKKKKAP